MSDEYSIIVHDPEHHDKTKKVIVSKSVYDQFNRYVWSIRKQRQRDKTCYCPRRFVWKCDADCDRCMYYAPDKLYSIDHTLDISDNSNDNEEAVIIRHDLSPVLNRIAELYPSAIYVGILREAGLSEREALRELNIPRTTYRSTIKKIEEIIRNEFGDFLE